MESKQGGFGASSSFAAGHVSSEGKGLGTPTSPELNLAPPPSSPGLALAAQPSFMSKLFSRFRMVSIVLALLQLGVLIMYANTKLSTIGRAVVTLGFFMLLLNVAMVSAAGWAVMSSSLKQGLVVLVSSALIAFLMWLVGDATERLPVGVMVLIFVLSAASWAGVLWLTGRIAREANAFANKVSETLRPKMAGGSAGGLDGTSPNSCGQCIMKMLQGNGSRQAL